MDLRYTIVMGCAESRENKINTHSISFTKSPLHLHIYPNLIDSNHYTIKTTPKSSSTTSSTTSPTALSTTSPTASPSTNTTTVAFTHFSRLKTIAHFKFPMFREFPKNVQSEILYHIDKELDR